MYTYIHIYRYIFIYICTYLYIYIGYAMFNHNHGWHHKKIRNLGSPSQAGSMSKYKYQWFHRLRLHYGLYSCPRESSGKKRKLAVHCSSQPFSKQVLLPPRLTPRRFFFEPRGGSPRSLVGPGWGSTSPRWCHHEWQWPPARPSTDAVWWGCSQPSSEFAQHRRTS